MGTIRNNDTNMISITDVEFCRGSSESPNEMPVSKVILSAFLIDRHPVTNKAFKAFIKAGGYSNQRFWIPQGWEYIKANKINTPLYWDDPKWNAPDHPVTGVSWWEASAFACFKGKSLSSEAQWECAARGVDERRYPWGNAPADATRANFAVECEPDALLRASTPVDRYADGVSPYGCLDMAGNVGEWCIDNASADYSWDLTRQDPLYLTEVEEEHILRGGSGLHSDDYLRCSSRDYYPPGVRDNIVGFRCVIAISDGN